MTTILVTNLHSSSNAGDAALTISALQQLHINFPESQLVLSMYDPDSHAGPEPVIGSFMTSTLTRTGSRSGRWKLVPLARMLAASLIPKWGASKDAQPVWRRVDQVPYMPPYQALIQAFQEADLVVSAPGNFLYSSGKTRLTLLHHLYTLWYATWLGKPLYLFPQSIGPFRRNWEVALVRAVLRRARIVMVREQISLNQLTQMGFQHPRLELVPDLAFAFRGVSQAEARAWLGDWGVDLNTGQPHLGMTAISWGLQNRDFKRQNEYEQALVEAAQGFIRQTGGQVVLFAQVCGPDHAADDRVPARRIANHLRDQGLPVVQIDEPAQPELLHTAYHFMDVFVGTRMHSNIFALAGGVPVLAIGYQHKTRGLMETLGLSDWVFDIDKIDGATLLAKLIDLWNKRDSLRQLIQLKVADLAKAAENASRWIAEDYSSWRVGKD